MITAHSYIQILDGHACTLASDLGPHTSGCHLPVTFQLLACIIYVCKPYCPNAQGARGPLRAIAFLSARVIHDWRRRRWSSAVYGPWCSDCEPERLGIPAERGACGIGRGRASPSRAALVTGRWPTRRFTVCPPWWQAINKTTYWPCAQGCISARWAAGGVPGQGCFAAQDAERRGRTASRPGERRNGLQPRQQHRQRPGKPVNILA
jgi:hypothetical protein